MHDEAFGDPAPALNCWGLRGFQILLVVILVQNVIAMVVSNVFPLAATFLLGVKEMLLALAITSLLLVTGVTAKLRKEAIIPALFIVFLIWVALFGSPYFNLVSLRQALVIPVFVLFGVHLSRKRDLGRLTEFICAAFLLTVLLGLFERLVLYRPGEPFFGFLGVREWAALKGWGYDVPASWYSADLLPWIGRRVRRVPGILIGDAVNFGQAMAFPFVLCVFSRRYFAAAIFLLTIILGLSKGGLLAAGTALALAIGFDYTRGVSRVVYLSVLGLLTAAAIILVGSVLLQVQSVADHLRGLTTNWIAIVDNPLGRGVGSAGNFANRFGVADAGTAIGLASGRVSHLSILGFGESYFGTFVGQLGLVGAAFYLYYPLRLLGIPSREAPPLIRAVKWTAVSTFFVGFFSETALTYVGTGILIALIPLALKWCETEDLLDADEFAGSPSVRSVG